MNLIADGDYWGREAYGGLVQTDMVANTSSNTLNLDGMHLGGAVGGYAVGDRGFADNNVVSVKNLSEFQYIMAGAVTAQSEARANGNRLEIVDSTVADSVDTSIDDNVSLDAFGVLVVSDGKAEASDNQVSVDGLTLQSSVFRLYGANVVGMQTVTNNNSVSVHNLNSGSAVAGVVSSYILTAGDAEVHHNSTTISQFNGPIAANGVYLDEAQQFENPITVNLSETSVTVDGQNKEVSGTQEFKGNSVYLGDATLNLSGTRVQIKDFINQDRDDTVYMYTGDEISINSGSVNLSDSSLVVSNVRNGEHTGRIYTADISLGEQAALNIDSVKTSIVGSDLQNVELIGVYVTSSEDQIKTKPVHINNSVVEISNSIIDHALAVYLDDDVQVGYSGNHTVKLTNAIVLNGVFGSAQETHGSGNPPVFLPEGNTLELSGVNRVRTIQGFDTWRFVIDDNMVENQPILTLAIAQARSQSPVNWNEHDNLTIEIVKPTDFDLKDENITLIFGGGNSTHYFNDTQIVVKSTFVDSVYSPDDFYVNSDHALTTGDENIFKNGVNVATANSATLADSHLGSIAFVNQGAEFVADVGMKALADAAKLGEVSAFAAMHGGSSRYDSSSTIDVDGYSLVVGAGLKLNPNWLLGAFVEAGWGESDSHVRQTKGESDHDYYGVGLATRYQFASGLYVDGALRLGQSSTEFKGQFATDYAKYDSDVFFSTAHLGAGYLFNLTDTVSMDVYGRYLISYWDSDSVNLHNAYSDDFDIESTTAQAVRVGTRVNGSFCPYADWTAGLAYERVFEADAETAVNRVDLDSPSLDGDTAIMELGVSMKPSVTSPWTLQLGAKGYVGDREGVSGNLTFRYVF